MNSKKKILLFNHSLDSGGSENVLSNIANFLVKKNYEVIMLTLSGEEYDDFYELDNKVRREKLGIVGSRNKIYLRFFNLIKKIFYLRKSIIKNNPDKIISFIDTNNLLMLISCFGLKKSIIISERVYPGKHRIPKKWHLLRKLLYKYSFLLVVQTNHTKRWFEKNLSSFRIEVIPNSVNLQNFSLEKKKSIIAVGRLEHQKGFDILIKAFSKIHSEFNEWNLKIYGKGSKMKELNKLASTLKIKNKINFYEPTKEIHEKIASSSLFVHPARYEGFPNVILEAMSVGTAVLASDCPAGPSEIIKHKNSGILFPVDNINILADYLRILLSDKQLRQKFEKNAKIHVNNYSHNQIMKRWEDLVNQ